MKYGIWIILLILVGCSGEGEATPDLTTTFEQAVSAELTRLAPAPTIASTIPNNATPTLAAVATTAIPSTESTPTLVPTATGVPFVIQSVSADKQGIEGDIFARGDVLKSADAPIYGDKISFFLVGAVDNSVGTNEGDGVQDVVFSIFGTGGTLVYQKIESTPAYCAFGGDFPCAPHDFSQNNFLWPSGLPLEAGTFSAEIVARGTTPERSATWSYEFQIQLEP